MVSIIFFSCSKDDSVETHDVMVNVSYEYSETPSYGQKIAAPSFTLIFKDDGKTVDDSKSSTSAIYDVKLTFTDGTTSSPLYVSSDYTGINTFKSIPNGKYIIWSTYKPYTFIAYSTYNKVVITGKDNEILMFKPCLDCNKNLGVQTWNEK